MSDWRDEVLDSYMAFVEAEESQSEDFKAFSQESYQKFIDIDPTDARRFALRAFMSGFAKEKKDKTLADYSEAIKLNPGIADWYGSRALIYWLISKDEEAIEDYSKAIELDSENPRWYEDRGDVYMNNGNHGSAIHDFTKVIELSPDKATGYVKRSEINLNLGYYDKGINDCNKAIKLSPHKAICYVKRSEMYLKLGHYDQAVNDCNKAIELEPEKADAYFLRSLLFRKENDREENVESDLFKAVELSKSLLLFYHLIFYHYGKNKDNKVVEIGNKFDWNSFKYLGSLEINVDNYLEPYENDYDNSRIKAIIGSSYFGLGDYEAAVKWLDEAFEYPLVNNYYEFVDRSQAWEKLSKQKETNAKIEERNKVIQDLSHSIKNLISTVIDPLENLKKEATVQPQIIQNALRGANLIREIVNAINLSYKGSTDDLIYDAKHNDGSDAMSLQSMFTESIKQSVSNMFDGKYFNNFMRKYFPEKKLFLNAKEDWTNLSQADDLAALIPFLETHFFDPDIDISNADQFVMGNEKGSAVKLLIMIQEIILNAVKYAAFIDRDRRFLKIRFSGNGDLINIKVENPFDEKVKTKTTGTGHVVISNFARLMGTEPVIQKENGVYSLQITFQNFWEAAAE